MRLDIPYHHYQGFLAFFPILGTEGIFGAEEPLNTYFAMDGKELICFKRVVKLRSRLQVEVHPDIRLGSKADQNSLATRH